MKQLLAALLALLSASVLGAGAALFEQSDYLSTPQEKTLSAEEAKYLANRRKDSISAELVRLNTAVFDSGVVTVVLRGVTHEFVGARLRHPPVREDLPGAKPGEPKFVMRNGSSWLGKSKSGGQMSLTMEDGSAVVYGTISDGTREFTVSNAGGKSRLHVIYEVRPSTRPAHDPGPARN